MQILREHLQKGVPVSETCYNDKIV
ncbi:MAG: hypothetical protein HY606_12615 [Planctomycetes bacterium]|nr:hypothetical protein [Planctomycetota bacterium]